MKRQLPLKCKHCQMPFFSKTRSLHQKYCSRKCYGLDTRKQYIPGRFKKGSPPWNKGIRGKLSHVAGRKYSKETIEKIRAGNKKRFIGKVLKTREIELLRKRPAFRYWREAVYKRDHWTCQDCGARSEKGKRVTLHPHHIKLLSTHPEKAYEVKNGVTLCSKCHQKRHKGIKLSLT